MPPPPLPTEEGGPESEFSGLMSSTVGADSGRNTLSEPLRRYRSAASAAAAAAAAAATSEDGCCCWGGGGRVDTVVAPVGWPLRVVE